MTYDWMKETKEYKKVLVLRFLKRVFFIIVALSPYWLPLLFSVKPESLFESSGIISKMYIFLMDTKVVAGFGISYILMYLIYFTCQFIYLKRRVRDPLYKELQDRADELSEKGLPELKAELKKLIEAQGEIKGYQYVKLMHDFEGLEKDLVIKAIRGNA